MLNISLAYIHDRAGGDGETALAVEVSPGSVPIDRCVCRACLRGIGLMANVRSLQLRSIMDEGCK